MTDAPYSDPDPVVEAYKKDIDRTLIRENLKLTVEERFRKAMALARFADEMRRAAVKLVGAGHDSFRCAVGCAFGE